jgi:hypothetical protein
MVKTKTIREMLAPGNRLDAGRACEVATLLLKDPRKTGQVVQSLWDEEAGVANRSADALERASSRRPQILAKWKDALLDRMLDAKENKLRWNLALTITRMPLTEVETTRAEEVLRSWLEDKSSIVKTSAMHGLAGLTRWNPSMLPEVLDILRILSRSGTPAMRARGRILLKRLEAKNCRLSPGTCRGFAAGVGRPTAGGRAAVRKNAAGAKAMRALRYG